jgi:type III restriction enzyme
MYPTLWQKLRTICETKARNELEADEVVAKANAAVVWCKHATDHAQKIGTKPWKYLLIPHDQVTEDKRLTDYLSFAGVGK